MFLRPPAAPIRLVRVCLLIRRLHTSRTEKTDRVPRPGESPCQHGTAYAWVVARSPRTRRTETTWLRSAKAAAASPTHSQCCQSLRDGGAGTSNDFAICQPVKHDHLADRHGCLKADAILSECIFKLVRGTIETSSGTGAHSKHTSSTFSDTIPL